MRPEHLLVSLIGILLCFLMILGGLFLFLCSYVPSLNEIILVLVEHHLKGISYFGLIFLFSGILLLCFLFVLNRRRYLLLKMGGVSIEERLIAHFAKESIQAFFPNQKIDCDVIVRRKKRIEILANVPFVSINQQKSLLQEIEKSLVAILYKQCQYEKDFILNVSFLAA